MSRNRHKTKNNHPKPIKKLIDGSSPYSPNSIGGRVDLEALRDKLFCQEVTNQQQQQQTTTNNENSETSLQGKGKAK